VRELSVLYVDDDPDIRHIVALSLSLDPLIEARFAGSGEEALAMLATGPRPDVAVLDVMMPEMDGLTLLERMRAMPATATIPVLFMTARAREADVAAYIARGAMGVIVKPFDPLSLAAAIRERMAAAGRNDTAT
jgi:CheY-like chemotaxis protein